MSQIKTAAGGPRNRHDQPVRMERFARSIRMRKLLLGLLIPVALSTRVSLIVLDRQSRWWPDAGATNTFFCGLVNLGCIVSGPSIHPLRCPVYQTDLKNLGGRSFVAASDLAGVALHVAPPSVVKRSPTLYSPCEHHHGDVFRRNFLLHNLRYP